MPNLLLEIFSEEIPARMQRPAAAQLEGAFSKALSEIGISYESAKTFVTPRRLAIYVRGLPKVKPALFSEKRGPREGAKIEALQGFAAAQNISVADLVLRDTDKGKFYFAEINEAEAPLAPLLAEILSNILQQFSWPKSMAWGANKLRWVRPVHRILCLLDAEIVPVVLDYISADRLSEGHRFLAPDVFSLAHADEYEETLKKNYVIADSNKREEEILAQANALAEPIFLRVKNDGALLEEVSGLVEFPCVLRGEIDAVFMSLPGEVLISVMRTHQRYFALQTKQNTMAPYFLTVANIPVAEKTSGQIIEGNLRVLRARLEDARFYWEQDLKIKAEERTKALNKIVFHASLGTVGQKVLRITELAKRLSVWIPGADLLEVEQAASACKDDLASGMVGEFPELQGIIGGYYARHKGACAAVADAISDHYRPLGPRDYVTNAPVSQAIALADKFDNLVGLFAAGEKPTGSRDPYALRRAALGIVRIIIENQLRLPLSTILMQVASGYLNIIEIKDALLLEVSEFIIERFKQQLRQDGARQDHLQAAFAAVLEYDDLYQLHLRTTSVREFLGSAEGKILASAYKRAANLLAAEEAKDKISYRAETVDIGLLCESAEKDLYHAIATQEQKLPSLLAEEKFVVAMKSLADLAPVINRFFDEITVNDSKQGMRKNRLTLLAYFISLLNPVADFSLLEG
jgi:glycyl-tRNA synthetase beta chain